MFTYKAKSVFTMGGLFDSEFSPAAGTCSIFADSLESEECAVMVHGMEDGKVAIGGQLFPKLIDWYQLPIYLKKRMSNLKKVYLLSCFNGVQVQRQILRVGFWLQSNPCPCNYRHILHGYLCIFQNVWSQVGY